MSRLFSRLENMGQDQNEDTPTGAPGRQNGVPADAANASASNGHGNATVSIAAGKPAMPSLLPGYAISTSLAMAAAPKPVFSRQVWPVRFWFVSLLLLVGSSLLTLALSERSLPLAVAPGPAGAATDKTDKEADADTVPNPAPAAAAADRPAIPSASASVTEVPAAPAPRSPAAAAAPAATPAIAPAAPALPDGSDACSEAMLAMNLCRKSSP